MRSRVMLPAVLSGLMAVGGCATKAVTPLPQAQILTGTTVSQADADVVTQGYRIVRLDNEEGQVAAAQSADPRVRALAAELIGKANQLYPQLQEQMRRASIDAPRALPADLAAKVKRIKGLHGRAFDRAYLSDQVQSHEQAVRVFQAGMTSVTDPGIKAVLMQALPVVEEDLAKLQALQGRIG